MESFHSAYDFYKAKTLQSKQDDVETARIDESSSSYAIYLKQKRKSLPINEEGEFVRYFNAPTLPPDSDIHAFWKSNALNYPILSAIAKDYLTVQASSVSSERAFSSGTNLVNAERCSLEG